MKDDLEKSNRFGVAGAGYFPEFESSKNTGFAGTDRDSKLISRGRFSATAIAEIYCNVRSHPIIRRCTSEVDN